MTATDARLNVRIDPKVKDEARKIYGSLGIDLSTAINVFLRKSIAIGGFPFNVTLETPNAITQKAVDDSEKDVGNSKKYFDIDALWDDLNREE